jgi:hypothetical protein
MLSTDSIDHRDGPALLLAPQATAVVGGGGGGTLLHTVVCAAPIAAPADTLLWR